MSIFPQITQITQIFGDLEPSYSLIKICVIWEICGLILLEPHPVKIRITSTLRLRQAHCKQSDLCATPFSFSRFEWLTYFRELPPIDAVTEPALRSRLYRNAQIDCRIF